MPMFTSRSGDAVLLLLMQLTLQPPDQSRAEFLVQLAIRGMTFLHSANCLAVRVSEGVNVIVLLEFGIESYYQFLRWPWCPQSLIHSISKNLSHPIKDGLDALNRWYIPLTKNLSHPWLSLSLRRHRPPPHFASRQSRSKTLSIDLAKVQECSVSCCWQYWGPQLEVACKFFDSYLVLVHSPRNGIKSTG